MLPYHRPPLSKGYLSGADSIERNLLRSAAHYEKERIQLHLGKDVRAINRKEKHITLEEGIEQPYDKLVIATGARPLIPPIPGIDTAKNLFPMRTAADAIQIRDTFLALQNKRVVIIGGGYIGLETAASLTKLGGEVTVLEREERVLGRVTAPVISDFFVQLHTDHGVNISTGKNVVSFKKLDEHDEHTEVICADGSRYPADMIVVGCGIRVNTELAAKAGLEIENGIRVDPTACTSDPDIYAIGDCTYHHNLHYDRFIRLESVQNAVDQAKVAALAICGQNPTYDALPWFWSDQFNVKLQMVGLSEGYDQALVRKESGEKPRFSVWYFANDRLLAVDAINNPKAYVLGTRFIKGRQQVDKTKLIDPEVEFKPTALLVT